MSVSEKEVEAELIRKVQDELGGVSLKTHVKNWPDRVCFIPDGRCFFVELKRPRGGRLSEGQKAALVQLGNLGHHIYTARCYLDVFNIIADQR